MTVYAWPNTEAWRATRFAMRLIPNTRVFIGPYTPTTQVIDLLGERWSASVELPPDVDTAIAGAREAFFDRLKGPVHQIALWHLGKPAPNGTLRSSDLQGVAVVNASLAAVTVKNASNVTVTVLDGTPVLGAAVAFGANTATVRCLPGRTLKAGDMLGFGGQAVRSMADATADANGLMAIEFQPRARKAIAAYTPLNTDRPTINFILKAEGVPVVYRSSSSEAVSLELIEAL